MAERHPNSARFHEILKELGDLHDKKGADYGRGDDPFANVRASSEWGMPAWVGAMVRLTDKVHRLQSLAQKGSLVNEAAEDSFRDIAVYSVIALVLYEQETKKINYEEYFNFNSTPPLNPPDENKEFDPTSTLEDDVRRHEKEHPENMAVNLIGSADDLDLNPNRRKGFSPISEVTRTALGVLNVKEPLSNPKEAIRAVQKLTDALRKDACQDENKS